MSSAASIFLAIVMAVLDLARIFFLSIWYIVEAIVISLLPRKLRAKSVVGELVLITGSGGGIGRLLARRFSDLGARVVVWDKDEQGVGETISQVQAAGGEAYGYVVDLADRDAIYRAAEKVKTEVGKVTMLINNAGIVFGKTLLELPDQEIDTTFQVNILAHYWTTKAFLGDMLANDHGHIVTVASVAGLMGTYRCTDYSASKFAAVGFHESLFTELQAQGHRNIYTTLICPYFINTGMFDGVKPRLMAMLDPSHVADEIVAAVLANEVTVTLPGCFRWLMPLKGILPAKLCWALMYHIMQGPQAMMTFRGRQKEQSKT